MYNLIKLVLLSLALLFASIASADGFKPENVRPYVGGGIGTYLMGNGSGAENVAGGYGMLGLEISPNFALELRAGQNLRATGANGKNFDTSRFVSYLVRPQMKLGDFNVFGLIGASKIKSWSADSPPHNVNKFSFSVGAGVEVNAYKNIMIGVEALILDGRDRAVAVPFTGNFLATLGATGRIKF